MNRAILHLLEKFFYKKYRRGKDRFEVHVASSVGASVQLTVIGLLRTALLLLYVVRRRLVMASIAITFNESGVMQC